MSKELAKKYVDIEGIKNQFLKKVEKVSYEKFNQKPDDDSWSLAQVFYHIYFVEFGTITTINKNLKADKVKLKAGFSNSIRSLLLNMILKSPFKFKAPQVVSEVPAKISLQEIKEMFDKNTLAFKTILVDLPVELEHKLIFKHPFAGLFTINETLHFVKEHYLHHEMQLDRLLR